MVVKMHLYGDSYNGLNTKSNRAWCFKYGEFLPHFGYLKVLVFAAARRANDRLYLMAGVSFP